MSEMPRERSLSLLKETIYYLGKNETNKQTKNSTDIAKIVGTERGRSKPFYIFFFPE